MKHQRSRQVKTTLKRYGKKYFAEIGSIGGTNSTTKFNSITGRTAANKRWEQYRLEQLKKKKGE